jgi:hypothetical protein
MIKLRPASPEDKDDLFKWRNDKFIMNVAAGDEKKTSILKNLGAKKIQTSFLLDLN